MEPFEALAEHLVARRSSMLRGETDPPLGPTDKFRQMLLIEAVSGDVGCMHVMLEKALLKLMRRQALDRADMDTFLVALTRAINDPHALRVMAGSETKGGAAKRGNVSLKRATEVLQHKLEYSCSVEAAWEAVAQARNVSVSAIKRDWARWKADLEMVFASDLEHAEPAPAYLRLVHSAPPPDK